MIVAGFFMIAYGFRIDQPVLAAWELLFLAINTYHIVILFRERRPLKLLPGLQAIHESVFLDFSPRDFLKFWNFGSERLYQNSTIIREGETPSELMFIVSGNAAIVRRGKTIVQLGPGQFVAEMSFLTKEPASATVRARGDVNCRVWSNQTLADLESVDPNVTAKLKTILGRDLSQKLADRMLDERVPAEKKKPGRRKASKG